MKRMVDLRCPVCEQEQIDVWLTDHDYPVCACGTVTERMWKGGSSARVIGDECDVWIKNGICNPDGTPKHYTSKEDIKRAAQASGWENRVEHIGADGSDKSKHTVRWV